MARKLRVVVEVGPKGKRCVVVASEWPGLERGGATREIAIERLRTHLPRYAKVAAIAKLGHEFAAETALTVVEEFEGTGSTDFWGVSFAFSEHDQKRLTRDQLDREMALMRACWTYFDRVRSRVSEEMQAGPRGGGRNRDRIVRHTLGAEQDWAKKLGVLVPKGTVVSDAPGLRTYRAAYCAAIRDYHAAGQLARRWPLRYLIRHTAYHTLDHAWEMEDKDLTA